MAGEHLRTTAAQLGANLGHAPDATETYLGHFLGTAGATQMLSALQATPNRPASAVLPEAASANTAMFYAKDGTPYSTTQFVQRVNDRVAKAYADLGYPMPQGALNFTGQAIAGQSANAPGVGASTSSVSRPRHSVTSPERMMLASLVEVFAQADRATQHWSTTHSKRNHGLPPGIVSALETASGDTPVGPLPLSVPAGA